MSSFEKKRGRPKGGRTCKSTLSKAEWCSSCISKRGQLCARVKIYGRFNRLYWSKCLRRTRKNIESLESSTLTSFGTVKESGECSYSANGDQSFESSSFKRSRKEWDFFQPDLCFFSAPFHKMLKGECYPKNEHSFWIAILHFLNHLLLHISKKSCSQ